MLVLTRRINQTICIGEDIEVTVVEVRGDCVRLGIQAPCGVPVDRREIRAQKLAGRAAEALTGLGHPAAPALEGVPPPAPKGVLHLVPAPAETPAQESVPAATS